MATCAALLVAAGIQFWLSYSPNRAHQIVSTRVSIESVSIAMKTLAILRPEALSCSSETNVNAFTLYAVLTGTNLHPRLLQPDSAWEAVGAVLDEWNRPLQVHRTFLHEASNGSGNEGTQRFRLWSLGPNGMDDGLEGDDIVGKSFDLPCPERHGSTTTR